MKAVVFDMDGVIFDTETAVIKAWQSVAEKYGIPDIESYCIACLGVNETCAKAYFNEKYENKFSYEALRSEKTALVRQAFAEGAIDRKEGAEHILRELRAHGYGIALASSTKEEAVREELTLAGLIRYFDVIVTGDMAAHSKPAPDIFLLACEKLGVPPREAYGIEDSFNGIRSSHAAGLYTIMVPDILQPDAEIASLADSIFPNLNAVLDFILAGGAASPEQVPHEKS
ncbi:MAG: HAD family phosphatase [Oscillospiraceae bacterium]|nr:HAD family phosphatase [Oscillospiraceae bacterium]